MLIISDFDGTVSSRDTNTHIARTLSPGVVAALDGRLAARELTVRDVLGAEFGHVTASLDEVVSLAIEVPLREGFTEFLDAADAAGHRVVLLSSGFRQIIEPMLAHAGVAGRVPLIANDIEFTGSGASITWRDLPACAICGEACKRHEVGLLRDGLLMTGEPHEDVVFIGDGLSDRCGADVADRIFARDSLADWLDTQGVAWEAWNTFHDIVRELEL